MQPPYLFFLGDGAQADVLRRRLKEAEESLALMEKSKGKEVSDLEK